MTIIDRRQNGSGKSLPNRQKFIKRYKRQIKESVDKVMDKRRIQDNESGSGVTIGGTTTDEPTFSHDRSSGKKEQVHTGNKQFQKGDTIPRPDGNSGSGRQGSPEGDGEDNFSFTLTKDEFYDLYFADMELPDFIKQSLSGSDMFKWHKAGYSKEGIPARLNIKKTFEKAIARKISTKSKLQRLAEQADTEEEREKLRKKKPRYLDDVDIRYDYYTKHPQPISKAVMFCVMDVSASMGEHEKRIAKKFFMLLYLFLERQYDHIEIRFIRHTHTAEEVSEEEFFYGTHSGGTLVSKAFQLVNQIITDEINLTTTNIYIAQASDGDNWPEDNEELIELLEQTILPKVQYFAYIHILRDAYYRLRLLADNDETLFSLYYPLRQKYDKFNCRTVTQDSEIYPVLADLFKKGGPIDE